VTADPPSSAGANHDTTTRAFPATPDTSRGADGTVRGVTAVEGCEVVDLPYVFAAVTVTV
jgi:hypothetical protein